MICLGIESTAHTFAIGIVSSKKEVLADARAVYKTDKGGIIPTEAATHHKGIAHDLVKQSCLEAESKGMKKIDLIAYSRGPGLSHSLHVGKNMAEELVKDLDIPFIGVNHPVAHLTSGHLFTEAKDPVYLYLSGANTQVIALGGKKFRVFGETLDVGLGNALDKFGREIGMGFPAGPKIEELAKKGSYVELPYAVKGMDTSFSGLVTKLSSLYKKGTSKEDLCFSFQETAFAMVTEVAERALAHTQKKELVVIGGVAANKRLATMLELMCKARNANVFIVPLKYAADNGVQIAYQGILEHQAGRSDGKYEIRPYERTDDITVTWTY